VCSRLGFASTTDSDELRVGVELIDSERAAVRQATEVKGVE